MVTATRKHTRATSLSQESRIRVAHEMSEIRHSWSAQERSSRLTQAVEAQRKLFNLVLGIG